MMSYVIGKGGRRMRGRRLQAFLKEVTVSLRKEVIQPHLPVRLPCYDFTPLTRHTFGTAPLMQVRLATSGTPNSGGVTGGVYKARERIHRAMLMRDY
jgi:hypothetical protein